MTRQFSFGLFGEGGLTRLAVRILQFVATRLGLVLGCEKHPAYHGARQKPRPQADGSLCPTCQSIYRANQ